MGAAGSVFGWLVLAFGAIATFLGGLGFLLIPLLILAGAVVAGAVVVAAIAVVVVLLVLKKKKKKAAAAVVTETVADVEQTD